LHVSTIISDASSSADHPTKGTSADAADNPNKETAANAADNPTKGTSVDAADNPNKGTAADAADNPTQGTSADAADNLDNPILSSSHVLLLPPRTGIGVQDTSPPPTASFSTAGDYATASSVSSASSENIANNPDNPYAGFDASVPVPDNPRKPASDHWAYVASRG
jgi:hypothetical protein